MGIVGISFGSPTAGTGFDVSNTVSQIVANLQNVEAPWKSQLGNLQAQDAVISSLGSLLAKVSTDIGTFTDFQGVLSGKQGSSSDPNVLALTSASTSAIAGTHTIVVNSLAATSSGYLNAVTNASDTLAGTLTIQVGSGTAQTITIGATDNTLVGLAATINSSGVGVTASLITDSNGSRLSLVSGTSGTGGDLTVGSSVTDSTTAAVLAYNSATAGANASLVVDGLTVSSASNTVSTVIPGVTFQLLAPSPVTGGVAETVQVQVLNNNTAVESSVATLVSDYNAVISTINSQETNTTAGTPEPLFASPTLTLLQEQLLGGINSTSSLGNLATVPAANVNDTLTGSLSLAVGTAAPTVFNLGALPAASQNLAGLASAINTAALGVTASVITDSTGSRLSFASSTAGVSQKLSAISTVADGTTTLAYTGQSDIGNLTQLGVSLNDDGTLSLNSDTLNTELNSDYSGVVSFFQNPNSWGTTFSHTLSSLGTSSVNGTLALGLNANSAIESSLNVNIANEDRIISTEQINLTLELTSANEILQAIPANLDNVAELYSAITGYSAPRF